MVAVWLPMPRRAHSVGCGVENGNKSINDTTKYYLNVLAGQAKIHQPVNIVDKPLSAIIGGRPSHFRPLFWTRVIGHQSSMYQTFAQRVPEEPAAALSA